MSLLPRFLKPYRVLIAVTLGVLLIDCAGTLLVPTMLANMVIFLFILLILFCLYCHSYIPTSVVILFI